MVWALGTLRSGRTDLVQPNKDIVALSGKLLYAVKTEAPTDSLEKALAQLSTEDLTITLSNDTARKTFWINIYNAYYQIFASREKKTKPHIFTDKAIHIGGLELSLDDVEHGILRKYRWKLSLGYLPQFWPGKNIKRLAVTDIDYRIHFALNCGAKSCPPIAFYDYDKLEEQLEMAASSFLLQETEVDNANKTVHITKIMQWFRADFGGKKGIKKILKNHLDQDFSDYAIEFKDYDWSEQLGNYQ